MIKQSNLCCVVIYIKHFFFCLTGQGFYCHLHGLRDLALSKDQELHSLFTDCGMDGFTLSTSTVPILQLSTVVFAPDVPDGFNVYYCVHDDTISCTITSYLNGSHKEFNRCVYKSLEDIFTVLEEKPLSSLSL